MRNTQLRKRILACAKIVSLKSRVAYGLWIEGFSMDIETLHNLVLTNEEGYYGQR